MSSQPGVRSLGLVDDHAHRWPTPLQALEHRSFRTLWLATFVSNVGSWMQRVASAWLIYTLSGSETWLGIDAAMSGLPTLLLLPFSGVLADRVDRRHVLVASNCGNALTAILIALLWWTGMLEIWHLIASSFISGAIGSIAAPASQSILPSVVGEDHLPNAIALNSVQYNVARAVGPAIGGVAMTVVGAGWCFLFNAVSYICVFAALLMLPRHTIKVNCQVSMRGSLAEGFAFLHEQANLRLILVLVGLFAFGAAPIVTLLPAIAKKIVNGESAGYSMLLTSFGAGACLSAVIMAIYQTDRLNQRKIIGAALILGILQSAIAISPGIIFAMTCCLLAGMAFVSTMIELGTALLSKTPDQLRGRISGVQQMCFRIAQPLGALLAGFLSQAAGVQIAFAVFGIALTLSVLLAAYVSRTHQPFYS